jgi:hypothetical protein
MTVLSYGMPRTGTTFTRRCFEKIPFVFNTNLNKTLRHHYNVTYTSKNGNFNSLAQMDGKIKQLVKEFKDVDKYKVFYSQLGEGRFCHPLNDIVTQSNLDWLVDCFIPPVYFFRTYRKSLEIYKSMVMAKFRPWASDSLKRISTMILAEHAQYIAFREKYNIISVDFDKFDDEIYLKNELANFNSPELEEVLRQKIQKDFTPLSARRGKKDIEVSPDIISFFHEIDLIRKSISNC